MDTKITREDLCITVENVYDKPDGFIFDVEANMANGFEVFCSIHEPPKTPIYVFSTHQMGYSYRGINYHISVEI